MSTSKNNLKNLSSKLTGNTLICAFEGWNDAGDAACDALQHLTQALQGVPVFQLETENLFDYTKIRPQLNSNTEPPSLDWPSYTVHRLETPDSRAELYTLKGPEPNYNWSTFNQRLFNYMQEQQINNLVLCGALLAEIPHTRTFPLTAYSYHPDLLDSGATKQTYTGPTGIVGVLAHQAPEYDIKDLSLWLSIPHYAGHAPQPKGTLEFLKALEDLFKISIPLQRIEDEAHAWDLGAQELMAEEKDLAAYVRSLELDADSYEPTGEDIAEEFEKYLKRKGL